AVHAGAAPSTSAPSPTIESALVADVAAPTAITIEAPMVGTFYRASAPTADPFVREGDVVKEGQVICIIEAMKLMNEIESKAAGRGRAPRGRGRLLRDVGLAHAGAGTPGGGGPALRPGPRGRARRPGAAQGRRRRGGARRARGRRAGSAGGGGAPARGRAGAD